MYMVDPIVHSSSVLWCTSPSSLKFFSLLETPIEFNNPFLHGIYGGFRTQIKQTQPSCDFRRYFKTMVFLEPDLKNMRSN